VLKRTVQYFSLNSTEKLAGCSIGCNEKGESHREDANHREIKGRIKRKADL
jgi:hypothetical protein